MDINVNMHESRWSDDVHENIRFLLRSHAIRFKDIRNGPLHRRLAFRLNPTSTVGKDWREVAEKLNISCDQIRVSVTYIVLDRVRTLNRMTHETMLCKNYWW